MTELEQARRFGRRREELDLDGHLPFGECAPIGFFGGLIGAGVALWMFNGGVTLGAALGGNGALWVTSAQALGALAVALAVSLVSGLVPIFEALRISPAMAFRKVV